MPDVSLFDVLGPWMVGPSSSHTAGACRMALTARTVFGEEPKRAVFTLYGSFADTYLGHGTDKALLGGVLGFQTHDPRIRDSFALAKARGLDYAFIVDKTTPVEHPNTAKIDLSDAKGAHTLSVRAVSTGGGKMKIVELDGVAVNFTGEHPTLIVHHQSVPGVISYFTGILGDHRVNIVSMNCYSAPDGLNAYSIVESDQPLTDEVLRDIQCNRLILKTILVQE